MSKNATFIIFCTRGIVEKLCSFEADPTGMIYADSIDGSRSGNELFVSYN